MAQLRWGWRLGTSGSPTAQGKKEKIVHVFSRYANSVRVASRPTRETNPITGFPVWEHYDEGLEYHTLCGRDLLFVELGLSGARPQRLRSCEHCISVVSAITNDMKSLAATRAMFLTRYIGVWMGVPWRFGENVTVD